MSDLPPIDVLEALACTAQTLYSATLVGDPAPFVTYLHDWMKKLEIGSLIMECSTFYRTNDHSSAIGLLEKLETRKVCSHEQADPNLEKCTACGDDDRWTEHYTWIRCADATGGYRRHRWYNASFIRIPRNQAEYREARGVGKTLAELAASRRRVADALADIERRGF
jgi:hypothetical protein